MIAYHDKMMRRQMISEVSHGAMTLLIIVRGDESDLKRVCIGTWGNGYLTKTGDHKYEWKTDDATE